MAEPNFDCYAGISVPSEVRVENLERKVSEEIYFNQVRPRLIKSLKRTIKGDKSSRLYNEAIQLEINPDNVFADSDYKRAVLKRIMGYKALRMGKGPHAFVDIDDAKEERIGEVYKKCFYQGKESSNH